MSESLSVIAEEDQMQQSNCQDMDMMSPDQKSSKHPNGFPKNIERMFETFHQTPSGEFKPTFYNPFEIKHRRRTSKDQFSVLESSFQENCKPNAQIRRSLAQKLGMTARAVQVWFQNRRAKMKMSGGGRSDDGCESSEIASNSTQCSSMASPDHTTAQPKKAASYSGKKAMARRHSMPNMAQGTPVITNEHFKQLHEAIFGGHVMTPQLTAQQQSLNYQVPMKPIQSNESQQQQFCPPSYYGNYNTSPQMGNKTRQSSLGPIHFGMDSSSSSQMQGSSISESPVITNDLDYFLQSIIVPQGTHAQMQQQQMFLSSLMQSDPSQIPGLSENLASFLTPTSPSPSEGNQMMSAIQASDACLLSKYMNDERFAD